MFEDFVQTSGHDLMKFDIRVRKFNRTMAVLNGTAYLRVPADDSYVASAVQITFEDFVQTLGRDYVLLDLRVRKYNRTLAVLNGTVDFLTPQYNILKFRVDIFHSRLGNQQFNHYPMKLPTQGVCDFLELLYERYSEQIAKFALAVQMMFEDFVQTLGQEEVLFNLRVRKYNRTLAVLNGTVDFLTSLTKPVQFRADFFHSRLGNQQFNHYPMKLPTQGVCDFWDLLYERYPEQLAKLVNPPPKGECPVARRQMHVLDLAFPPEVIPPVVPKGLWKAVLTGSVNNTEVISYYLVWRALDWL
ncbi:uncharacterized protein LOC131208157 [Anopheles bellator]|uniref:uncharacterized protein LOC131208157 n=1 Tax=Anopheles bellator TaxID=139047 RepID=UPI0026470D25|nr:uncharacterized protein LOC131208157 [Anopheles bellator]